MKHYGDITKLSGYDLPTVDIITGGSPCQDLSVAGKRAGLAGERSGLFMEQMRIVKEMRERDRKSGRTAWAVRPRYMVWENVPGAFSSGKPKGADFAAVIEEIIKVAEPGAAVDVCVPDRGWPKSGCYYAEDGSWSIAWRLHDAQFWGVPQRRKRIALVADFGGLSAPQILFERQGLRGDSSESGAQREGTARGTESGAGRTICLQGNGIDRADTAGCNGRGWCEDVSYTLNTIDRPAVMEPILLESNQNHATIQTDGISTALPAAMGMGGGYVPMVAGFKSGQGSMARSIGYEVEKAPTLPSEAGGNSVPAVYDARGNGNGETAPTLTGDHQDRVTDFTALCVGGTVVPALVASAYKGPGNTQDGMAVLCFQNTGQGWWNESEVGATIRTPCGGDSVKANLISNAASIVRRLTPLECERLQGYPDGWTDIGEWTDSKGKRHKDADSPRYKALGNSIALPFWAWLARRICAQYERPMTMASLFDGIGGFPLVFSRAGAVPVWASEIEEFPIAVTKRHFPEVEE